MAGGGGAVLVPRPGLEPGPRVGGVEPGHPLLPALAAGRADRPAAVLVHAAARGAAVTAGQTGSPARCHRRGPGSLSVARVAARGAAVPRARVRGLVVARARGIEPGPGGAGVPRAAGVEGAGPLPGAGGLAGEGGHGGGGVCSETQSQLSTLAEVVTPLLNNHQVL